MKVNDVLLVLLPLLSLSVLAFRSRCSVLTTVTINASSERVWSVLADLDAYSSWNPLIRRFTGWLGSGEVVEMELQTVQGQRLTIRPTIIKLEVNRELRWLGRLWLPWFFDGEHFFVLTSVSSQEARLEHGEHFRGLLVPLVHFWLKGAVKQGFEQMNEALKARVEARA